MLRVESGRWLNVAILVLCFTVLGFGLAYRFGGGLDAPAATLISGTQIGAAIGAAAGVIALIAFALNDSRRIEVARRLPHALVVQAERDPQLTDSLTLLAPGASVRGALLSVAFDTEGVSIYTGSTRPEQVLFVPAREVLEVSLGEPRKPTNTRGKTVPRMRVVVAAESGTVTLQFALRRLQGLGTGFETMTQAQVAAMVDLANNRRGGTASRGAATPYFAFSDDRLPGATAWSLLRAIRIYLWVFGVLLIAGLAALFALILVEDNVVIVLGAFLLGMVLIYAPVGIMRRMMERARKRERAAGYTTLNGLDLDLRQLQPLTGRMIRAAGAPPLSNDEFRRALSMA